MLASPMLGIYVSEFFQPDAMPTWVGDFEPSPNDQGLQVLGASVCFDEYMQLPLLAVCPFSSANVGVPSPDQPARAAPVMLYVPLH